MSTISLKLETDASGSISAVNQLNSSMESLNTETKTYAKTSDAAFASATNNADELNDELKKTGKSAEALAKGAKAVGASGNRIKDLKNEIKELKSEAFKAGEGTAVFAAKLKEAGKLTDEINDINAALKSVASSAGENVAGAFGEMTSVGIAGFEGVTAASSLLGLETENVEAQLLKLQSIKSLGNVVKEFAGLGDKITEIKLGLAPLTDAFKNQASSIASGYSTANEGLKSFGKNFTGNVSSAVKGLTSNLGGFFKGFAGNMKGVVSGLGAGIKTFTQASVSGIKAMGAALSANPLGLILVVIGAIIGIMLLLKDKIKPIAALFEFWADVLGAALDGLEAIGEALGLTASEQEKNSEKVIKNTEKEVAAIGKRYDREIALAEAAGKDTEELEKQKLKAQALRTAESISQLQAQKVRKKKLTEEELKEELKLQEEFADLVNEINVVRIKAEQERLKKQQELEKKNAEEAKKREEERKKRLADLNAALLELHKKSEQAILNVLTGKEKIEKQRAISLLEIKDLEKALIEKGKLTNRAFKLNAEQEQELANIRFNINKDANDKLIQLQVDNANIRANARQKEVDDEVKSIKLKADLAEAAITAVAPPKDATKSELLLFEKQQQLAILEVQKQSAQEQVAIQQTLIAAKANAQITALNGEAKLLKDKNDEISNERKAAIEVEKAAIISDTQTTQQLLVAQTESAVNAINKEISKIGEEIKPKKIDFAKLLGGDAGEITALIKLKTDIEVDPKDIEAAIKAVEQTTEALKSIAKTAFDSANAELDQQLANQDELIAKRDESISELESQLSEEQALRDEGIANNTSAIEAQLAAEELAREKDIEAKKAVQEQKKELAKQQLIIDTALGASALALAVAQLYAALSGFVVGPVPVGTIIATTTAAAMITAFALAKVKAFEAVNSASEFYEGGYTGDIGTKEVAGQVHGREFVMNAKNTDKYFDLFQGIHTGDKKLMQLGLSDLLKDTGVVLPLDISKRINQNKDQIRSNELSIISNNNNKGVELRLEKLEQHLVEIIAQGKTSEVVLNDGSLKTKKGTHTSIIRNGNTK